MGSSGEREKEYTVVGGGENVQGEHAQHYSVEESSSSTFYAGIALKTTAAVFLEDKDGALASETWVGRLVLSCHLRPSDLGQ